MENKQKPIDFKPDHPNDDIIYHPKSNYIFQIKSRGLDKWWFWDESYWEHGPFISASEANRAMWDYMEYNL